MLQQQAFGPSGGRVKETTEEDAFVRFDPAMAVSGIVYHLIDEKLAKTVAPDSIRRTIDRLAAKSFHPCLARAKWARMTNPQRLEWLLNESQTLTLVGDNEMVMLRARRSS